MVINYWFISLDSFQANNRKLSVSYFITVELVLHRKCLVNSLPFELGLSLRNVLELELVPLSP